MVVVYLKNGEKAPMLDASYVRIDTAQGSEAPQTLRCFLGQNEVGVFKWEEVAGYTISALRTPDAAQGSYETWNSRGDFEP